MHSTRSIGPRRDMVISSGIASLFSFVNGITSLILPILAADSGISVATIGLIYAATTTVQITLRPALAIVLRFMSDKMLVQLGSLAQLMSLAVLLDGVSVLTLSLAWTLQGIARACFWTGMDTHASRNSLGAAKALGHAHAWASLGQLIGPLVAGAVSQLGVAWALAVGMIISAACLVPGARLTRYPSPEPSSVTERRSMWRSPGVGASFFAGCSAGGWRGLLDSLIPAMLREAGHSFSSIGIAVAIATALSIPGAVVVTRLKRHRTMGVTYALSTVAVAVATATVALGPDVPALAFPMLALGGLGAGILQTLGPLLAAVATAPGYTADAIAWHGMFRTLSMAALPATASALAPVLPIAVTLAAVGALIGLTAKLGSAIGGPPRAA